MKPMNYSRTIVLTVLCLFAGTAYAHPGHPPTGFAGGFAHPFLGVDHLFAMIAVGLWAAQQGERALWAVPAAFVGAMGMGGLLAWTGVALPHVETAIALSVLLLPIAMYRGRLVPLWVVGLAGGAVAIEALPSGTVDLSMVKYTLALAAMTAIAVRVVRLHDDEWRDPSTIASE